MPLKTPISMSLDLVLADKVVKILGAHSREEAIHMALREILNPDSFADLIVHKRKHVRVRPVPFKDPMAANRGKLSLDGCAE